MKVRNSDEENHVFLAECVLGFARVFFFSYSSFFSTATLSYDLLFFFEFEFLMINC